MISLFSPSNANKFITHTPIPLKRIVQSLIRYPYWKPNPGVVSIGQNKSDKSNMGDNVFQISELVDPYQVSPSIDLEKNSNFYVFDNIFIVFDVEELNVVLSFNG